MSTATAIIFLTFLSALAAVLATQANSRYWRLMATYLKQSAAVVDSAQVQAGLLVKIAEYKHANSSLFEKHSANEREIAELKVLVNDWQAAYESLADEVDGADEEEDEDEEEDFDWSSDAPADVCDAHGAAKPCEACISDAAKPTQAARDWMKANDIEWGDDVE